MEPLWTVRAGLVPYHRAWAWQRALVERRAAGEIPDTVLLLEHPHVFTIGKRGGDADVLVSEAWLAAQGAEVVHSDRGGQVTYHGPGQLVGYPITPRDTRIPIAASFASAAPSPTQTPVSRPPSPRAARPNSAATSQRASSTRRMNGHTPGPGSSRVMG